MRFAEFILFLSPILLFFAWRLTASAGGPSRRAIAAFFALLVLMIAALLWFQREGALPPDTAYVPATLDNGRIVPGHSVPR